MFLLLRSFAPAVGVALLTGAVHLSPREYTTFKVLQKRTHAFSPRSRLDLHPTKLILKENS